LAKRRYWLDTNVFIDAKNHFFAFDLVPKFWKWLEDQMNDGVICSSKMVYNELCRLEGSQDELHKWAKQRRNNGYWIKPDKSVQELYGQISTYVHNTYDATSHAKTVDFLDNADAWVIAHALEDKGTLVTEEVKVSPQSKSPKIPNVCEHFNVPYINTTALLRALKFRAD
jgi:Domain of unknown function (DUF4411)